MGSEKSSTSYKKKSYRATSYLIHAKADKTCLHREKNEADVLTKV